MRRWIGYCGLTLAAGLFMGALISCGGGGGGGGGGGNGDGGSAVINELLYDAVGADTEGVFVELYGTPGMDLGALTLVGVNGSGGSVYVEIPLSGAIPSDGYYVIANTTGIAAADSVNSAVDLQNGPDSVMLVRDYGGANEELMDALAYGSFAGTAYYVGEGTPAVDVQAGHSLSRYPDGNDTDDNSMDFYDTDIPTPGSANIAGHVVINELLYDAAGADTDGVFVELYGPEGLDLGALTLVGVNGNDGLVYVEIPLSGTIPAGGFYVIANTTTIANADAIDASADFQNGPDSVMLVYDYGGANEELMDALAYGSFAGTAYYIGEGTPATDVIAGHSLSRCPDGDDTDDNSADFVDTDVLTPGGANNCI